MNTNVEMMRLLHEMMQAVFLEGGPPEAVRYEEEHDRLINALEWMHQDIEVLSGWHVGKRSWLRVLLPDGRVHEGARRPNGWVQYVHRLIKELEMFCCGHCGRRLSWESTGIVYGCECGARGYESLMELYDEPDFVEATSSQALALLATLDNCLVEGPLGTVWYRRPADFDADRPGTGSVEGPATGLEEVEIPLRVDPWGSLDTAQRELLLSAQTETAFQEALDACRRGGAAYLVPRCEHCRHCVSVSRRLGWCEPELHCAYPLLAEDLAALRRPARYRAPGDPDDVWNGLVDLLVSRAMGSHFQEIEDFIGLGALLQGPVEGMTSPICARYAPANRTVEGRPIQGVEHPHLRVRAICGLPDLARERMRRGRALSDPEALDRFVKGLHQASKEVPGLQPEELLWRSYSQRTPKERRENLVALLRRALPREVRERGDGASWAEAFGFFDATEGFLRWADRQIRDVKEGKAVQA